MVQSGSSNGSNQPVVSLGSKSCGISNLGLQSWVAIIKHQQDWDKGRWKWIETYWHMHKNYHKDLKIPCDPRLSPRLRFVCHFAFQISIQLSVSTGEDKKLLRLADRGSMGPWVGSSVLPTTGALGLDGFSWLQRTRGWGARGWQVWQATKARNKMKHEQKSKFK